MITQELLLKTFDYVDGVLYWKVNKGTAKAGDMAGKLNHDGYRHIQINGKQYASHRLIFMMYNGYLPKYLDHIDGNRSNNHIANLREVTSQQNSLNRQIGIRNKSGVKGVVWHKKAKKWQAQLNVGGVVKYFGLYNDIDYAKFIVEAMRCKYHKEFANHG